MFRQQFSERCNEFFLFFPFSGREKRCGQAPLRPPMERVLMGPGQDVECHPGHDAECAQRHSRERQERVALPVLRLLIDYSFIAVGAQDCERGY